MNSILKKIIYIILISFLIRHIIVLLVTPTRDTGVMCDLNRVAAAPTFVLACRDTVITHRIV